MERICWPYFDPEYENLSQRINPPSVTIDNTTCSDCTLIKVDSVNRPGILLEVVQVLTDLDLIISKAYISSDGGWFMDVFHVTDQLGNKVTDGKTIQLMEKALGPKVPAASHSKTSCVDKSIFMPSMDEYTAIELSGTDRPGLLSEICAILSCLQFNVVAAEMWTHNAHIACVIYVNDINTCHPISDPVRLAAIEEQFGNVLRGRDDDGRTSRTHFSMGFTHTDRRLHQMMFADRDYEGSSGGSGASAPFFRPMISVDGCEVKGYSVINVRCKDRPKLLFDTVCTLTDMQYVVFHASITSDGPYALQEYFIRHKDGCTLDTPEKERVIKCLHAAIQRRVSEGLSLELCARDRVGLLSDVTRALRENGLTVLRADVTTVGDKAVNVFYVGDASGNPALDVKTIDIEALRKAIAHINLNVNVKLPPTQPLEQGGKSGLSFGSLLERFLA